jgi:hypothetical protein
LAGRFLVARFLATGDLVGGTDERNVQPRFGMTAEGTHFTLLSVTSRLCAPNSHTSERFIPTGFFERHPHAQRCWRWCKKDMTAWVTSPICGAVSAGIAAPDRDAVKWAMR